MSVLGVSIVIPTFRRGASLARTLDALSGQTTPPAEILVVDQNPQGWLEAEVGAALSAAHVVWSEKANASAARNLGFVLSTAEVVLFIDDDLIPEPDFLERATQRLKVLPEVGCLCPLIVTDRTGQGVAAGLTRAMATRKHPAYPAVLAMPSVISAAMFFRRATYERSGGFDELLFEYARAGEDQELCFRMRQRALEVWVDTELAIFHDEHVPGGCELRSRPFWESRKRAIRSNVLRARLHASGRLKFGPTIRLFRSAFLNSDMMRNSPIWTIRNAALLADAVLDSRRLLRARGLDIPPLGVVDHIAMHRKAQSPA